MNFEYIIDELDPVYKAITDEQCILSTEKYGIFTRTFKNLSTTKEHQLTWKVDYGTPETVQTTLMSNDIS